MKTTKQLICLFIISFTVFLASCKNENLSCASNKNKEYFLNVLGRDIYRNISDLEYNNLSQEMINHIKSAKDGSEGCAIWDQDGGKMCASVIAPYDTTYKDYLSNVINKKYPTAFVNTITTEVNGKSCDCETDFKLQNTDISYHLNFYLTATDDGNVILTQGKR